MQADGSIENLLVFSRFVLCTSSTLQKTLKCQLRSSLSDSHLNNNTKLHCILEVQFCPDTLEVFRVFTSSEDIPKVHPLGALLKIAIRLHERL